jgi:polysaccharide export outer membrane protein
VDGQVTQPGNVPVVNQMTLMRASAAAQGATELAKHDDLVVLRKLDGQQMAALYNLGAIRRGNYGDPVLYPLDIVVVGNSPARRLFRDIISTAPLLSAPIIALTR